MIREDYRRALIMLRGLKRGAAGHVRLERRTLLATLQFTVTGTGGAPLQGFLLGQVNGVWRGATLGALGASRHGQAGLTARFDPRNLQGLSLEQYSLIGVAEQTPAGASPILIGNLNGPVSCSADCIRAACERLFALPDPAPVNPFARDASPESDALDAPAEAPSPEASTPSEASTPAPDSLDAPAEAPSPEASTPSEASTPEPDSLDAPAEEPSPEASTPSEVSAPEPDALDTPAEEPSPEASTPSEASTPEPDALDAPAEEPVPEASTPSETSTPEPDSLDAPAEEPSPEPDAPRSSPVLPADCEWPEALSDLRAFFQRGPIEETPLREGYAFVRAGLACAGGADYCLVGVRVQEGRIQSVCYAVPAQLGETEPPAGLENYRREGDYWLFCQPLSENASSGD